MRLQSKFPPGRDAKRVREVIAHYERQSQEEAVADDEAAAEDPNLAILYVPKDLVPAIGKLSSKHSKP
jgi:hypothetical protein